MQKLVPLNNFVLIRRQESQSQTKSGLFIPESARDKSTSGEVLAVGPGTLQESGLYAPVLLNVGDSVLFAKYGGTEITMNGETLVLVRADEIQGRLINE